MARDTNGSTGGSGDWFEVTAGTMGGLYDGSAAISYSAWVRPDVVNATQRIFSFYVTGTNNYNLCMLTSSGFVEIGGRSQSSDSFTGAISSATQLVADTWYHLGFVFDYTNAQVEMYQDGSLDVDSDTSGGWGSSTYSDDGTSTQTDAIGTDDQDNLAPLNGSFSELGIWNTRLVQSDFTSLAAGYTCDQIKPANLLNHYRCQEKGGGGNLIDARGLQDFTDRNAVAEADQPRLILPHRQRLNIITPAASGFTERGARRGIGRGVLRGM